MAAWITYPGLFSLVCYFIWLYVDRQMLCSTFLESILFYFSILSPLQAVQNGFWIVFEDIDRAPPDVHSVLMPLLEGAGSFMTGHGEVISLHFDSLQIK